MSNLATLPFSDWLGIVGLAVTSFGAGIAWITWINPFKRMSWFMLNRPEKWEKRIYTDTEENEQWVYKPNPAFRIHIGKVVNDNFVGEPWLPNTPEGTRNINFEVHLIANGIRLLSTYFIGIDDLRLFIPTPETPLKGNGKSYTITKLQQKLHSIIGDFKTQRYGKDLSDFASKQGIALQ